MSNEYVFMCPVLNSDNPHTMKYEYLLNGNIAGKKSIKKIPRKYSCIYTENKKSQSKI